VHFPQRWKIISTWMIIFSTHTDIFRPRIERIGRMAGGNFLSHGWNGLNGWQKNYGMLARLAWIERMREDAMRHGDDDGGKRRRAG